jgi:hypothetical protein
LGKREKPMRFSSRLRKDSPVADFSQGRVTSPSTITVSAYVTEWAKDRREIVEDWKSDESRLRLHVLPAIGTLALEDAEPVYVNETPGLKV